MNPEAHRFCFFENGLGFAPESAELRENRDFGGFRGTEFWNKVFFKFRKSRKYLDCSEVLRSTKKIPWESRESKRCCIVSYNFECHQPSASSLKTLFQIWKLCSKSRWCFILRLHEIQPLKTDILL